VLRARTSVPAMRAILYASDYPPNDGGIARLCWEIAAGLRRYGTPVEVIAPAPRNGTPKPISSVPEVRVSHDRPWWELVSYGALCRRRLNGPVICGLWYPDGVLAQAAGVRPRVILAHGSELMPAEARWRRGLWGRMLRNVCESADLVVANSEYTRKLVIEKAPRAKVVAIPLAVDHEHFSPGDCAEAKWRFGLAGKVVLSSVSRMHAYKGHDVVLRAMAALSKQDRENMVYQIAGKGPHKDELERLAMELGLKAQVRFLGFIPEEKLPDLYRASDLFVLCTREAHDCQEVEGFGLVFLEAQACGTPVVGVRTGGIPDAVKEGEGGWLIKQDDVVALAEILCRLVHEPTAFRAMGSRARERVERECTWKQYVRRFVCAMESEGIGFA
jgi:phosphatidylinositol alpha-1,6-mannosyltransferase